MVLTFIYFSVIYYIHIYKSTYIPPSKDFKDDNLYYLTLYNTIKPSELIKYQSRNIEVISTTTKNINHNNITTSGMPHVAVQLTVEKLII